MPIDPIKKKSKWIKCVDIIIYQYNSVECIINDGFASLVSLVGSASAFFLDIGRQVDIVRTLLWPQWSLLVACRSACL
jgi:hypothetical protein